MAQRERTLHLWLVEGKQAKRREVADWPKIVVDCVSCTYGSTCGWVEGKQAKRAPLVAGSKIKFDLAAHWYYA
uniref:Uncharacterized protein n=1 Tax=Oryza glumipatula TaxID=40148 RepID=A0A0E0AK37_9ORYZ